MYSEHIATQALYKNDLYLQEENDIFWYASYKAISVKTFAHSVLSFILDTWV